MQKWAARVVGKRARRAHAQGRARNKAASLSQEPQHTIRTRIDAMGI